MKNLQHFLPVLFLALFVTACENDGGGTGDGTDSTATDTVVLEAPMVDPQEFPPQTFGYFGLDILNVGDSLTFAKLDTEVPVKDTLFMDTISEGGESTEYAWSVRMLEFERGRVFLEADFDQNIFLFRARIETPDYRHFDNGLGVGSTVADIKKVYPTVPVQPFPEFGVIELVPNNHNIYHIPMPEGLDPAADLTVDDLDAQARVVRVVVM